MEDRIVEGKRIEIEPGVFSFSFEDRGGLYMRNQPANRTSSALPTILDLMDEATGYIDWSR